MGWRIDRFHRYTGTGSEEPRAWIGTDRWMLSEFDSVFLQALTEQATERGWQLVELEFFGGKVPEGVKLDGIFARALYNSDRFKQLRKFADTLVRIGSAPNPDDHLLPAVLPDMEAQGRLAVKHFSERGFRHVGFIGRRPWSIYENMYIGVERAAKEAGVEAHLLQIPILPQKDKSGKELTRQDRDEMTREIVTNWLLQAPRPLGVLATSDGFAARYCAWARSAGISVPTDVAVLGTGNTRSICERSLPRLSSIDISEYERGVAACELMGDLLAGKKPPTTPIMIPPSGVTVRESSDVLASVDPTAAEALRFMWANIAKDLGVDDIATHVGVHRRKLERLFRDEFGRGVNAELKRRRLEKSGELLRETDLTVTEIAPMVGFRSDDYFYRAFRREFGVTPLQWRTAHEASHYRSAQGQR